MDESCYETFEEELGEALQDTHHRTLRATRAAPLRKTQTNRDPSGTDPPWSGVTLNRCLIVAMTVLMLSSGLQRLNEALWGHRSSGVELTAPADKQILMKRGRTATHQDSWLWDSLLGWMADEDDESRKKSLRHQSLTDLTLLKKRESSFPQRRGQVRRTVETDRKNKKKKDKRKAGETMMKQKTHESKTENK